MHYKGTNRVRDWGRTSLYLSLANRMGALIGSLTHRQGAVVGWLTRAVFSFPTFSYQASNTIGYATLYGKVGTKNGWIETEIVTSAVQICNLFNAVDRTGRTGGTGAPTPLMTRLANGGSDGIHPDIITPPDWVSPEADNPSGMSGKAFSLQTHSRDCQEAPVRLLASHSPKAMT